MDPNEHVLDDLGGQDAHHVLEVSIMVATDGPLSVGKLEEIRAALATYIKGRGYPQRLVAEQKLNTNEAYLSAFLNKHFDQVPQNTLQKLARDANAWMEFDHRKRLQDREARVVQTTVLTRGKKAIFHGMETNDIVVLHSPAGSGKTTLFLEMQKVIPGSMYVYVTPDSARKAGFVKALYEVTWQHRGPARPTLTDVLDRLRFSDRLLMVDNADLLDPSVYPVLMALHDVAKIPIVLAGTHRLLQKLTSDEDPLRGQMSSRIGLRAELLSEQTSRRPSGRRAEWITADQVREIFQVGRVKLHPGTVARLKAIANTEIGMLRRCERLVRYAVALANQRSGDILITPERLAGAISLVDGEPVAVQVEEQQASVAAG